MIGLFQNLSQKKMSEQPSFTFVAKPDGSGAKHSIGITSDGRAFSWGKNHLGQLGRDTTGSSSSSSDSKKRPLPVEYEVSSAPPMFSKAYVGGFGESGHSALLDSTGSQLWFSGCDRWQQLGLGSAQGGSSGYTWDQGRIWRNKFVRNDFLTLSGQTIRDVALGGDHTVVLSSNQKDVYVFGKGGDGQLGVDGKPFVSAPTRSKALSEAQQKVAAVCAIHHCSFTLDDKGCRLRKTGKCRSIPKDALQHCMRRAASHGLLKVDDNEDSEK